jgi:steroid delta-isomerase-like uncharacterized protein
VSESNTALACQWFEQVWNQQRLSAVDELAAPHCKAHGHAPNDQVIGLAEFKEFARSVLTAFPDIQVTVEETISEGNRTLLRWHARMTHRGPFMGAPPSGTKVEVRGMSLMYFEGGRIVEAWDNWDKFGMLQTIGAIPESAAVRTKAS